MYKNIILIFVCMMFSLSFATPITGGIKYNEATARIAAFKDLSKKMDKKVYKNYLKDPNKKENLIAIKEEKYDLTTRILCPFYYKKSLLSYAVTYTDNSYMVFYYNILGNLVKFDIVEENQDGERTIGYSRFGNLMSVSFSADDNEQFVYDEKGKLVAHWLDDELVYKKFKILNITRKSSYSENNSDLKQ